MREIKTKTNSIIQRSPQQDRLGARASESLGAVKDPNKNSECFFDAHFISTELISVESVPCPVAAG